VDDDDGDEVEIMTENWVLELLVYFANKRRWAHVILFKKSSMSQSADEIK